MNIQRDFEARVVSVDSFEEADREDREFYWSLSPTERWELMEELRRRNYGDEAIAAGLLRLLEVAQRA